MCKGDGIVDFTNLIGHKWLEGSTFISQVVDDVFRITPEDVLFH